VPSEVEVEQPEDHHSIQVVHDMFKKLEDSCRHQQDNANDVVLVPDQQHKKLSPDDDHNPSEHQDLQLDGGGDELVIFDRTNMNDDVDDHLKQQQQLHQHQLPLAREEKEREEVGDLQLEPQVDFLLNFGRSNINGNTLLVDFGRG
jgi:hypothetical protein